MKIKYEIKDTSKLNNNDLLLKKLFTLRNVINENEINLLNDLEHYSNLYNIEIVSDFLTNAIINKKKLCVVADYDVDGATSCAIAVRGFKNLGANIDFFVPNRFIHGYGLSVSVIKEVKEKINPDIIITVDNGIASIEGVDYAHSIGIEVVITDHHLEGDKIPNTNLIINPNQKKCTFKNKSMAGCGVIYYVVSAVAEKLITKYDYPNSILKNVFSLIDLVAIGTISDVVKLTEDNRKLIKHGLSMIRRNNTKIGIKELIKVSNKNTFNLSTVDVGFGIAPKINAAGRLEDMKIGINCLLTEDIDVARSCAEKLNLINLNRKNIEEDMKNIAFDMASVKNEFKYSMAIYDESFHEGVIGIVASRIKDFFYKPTIVFAPAEDSEHIKGSGRSIPEIHLKDVLDYIAKKDNSIILKYGGHAPAAGLTIYKEKLENFKILFDEAVNYYRDNRELENKKFIDLELKENEFTLENAKIINQEIWGQGFPQPLFKNNFYIAEQRILNNKHLKLKLIIGHTSIDAIWFSRDSEIDTKNIDLVFTMSVNNYKEESLQLMIEGIFE